MSIPALLVVELGKKQHEYKKPDGHTTHLQVVSLTPWSICSWHLNGD